MPIWPFVKKSKPEPDPEIAPLVQTPIDPEVLLEREKASFSTKLAKFDENLLEHKKRLEELEKKYNDLLIEYADLTASIPSLIAANSMVSAKKKAIRLDFIKHELPIAKAGFKAAQATYTKLVNSRNVTKDKAEKQLSDLEKSIMELKAAKALAEINTLANSMASSLDGPTNLNDLERIVEEAKLAARVKARMEGDSIRSE